MGNRIRWAQGKLKGTPRTYPLSDPDLSLFGQATARLALASHGIAVDGCPR
jgi:hypothetical protein